MRFEFASDFRITDNGNFRLLFKIEGTESEKKHRSKNEKDHGLRKPSETIKNRGEDEVYEKKEDVHRV